MKIVGTFALLAGLWAGGVGVGSFLLAWWVAGERPTCRTVEAYVESPAAYPTVHPCGGAGGGAGQHLCVSVKTN